VSFLSKRYAPLMRFMADLGLPRPRVIQMAAEVTRHANSARRHKAVAKKLPVLISSSYLRCAGGGGWLQQGAVPGRSSSLSKPGKPSFEYTDLSRISA